MNDKKYYVYYHRDPRPKYYMWKRYIGKGIGNRAYETKNRSARHKRWINCLKKQGLNPIVEIVYFFDTEQEAFSKERELILKYRNLNYDLCNIHEGGLGGSTGPCSSKTKQKISKTLKDKNFHLSKERIDKIKKANSLRTIPEEHKEIIRESNKKRIWKDSSRAKIAKSKIGKKAWNNGIPRNESEKNNISKALTEFYKNNPNANAKSKKILCHQNNIVYNSQLAAAKDLGIPASSISAYLRGLVKKIGKIDIEYTFEFVV